MKVFKDFSLMNAMARKQNLEREGILKILLDLESLGIFHSDNLNSEDKEEAKEF